MFAIRFDGLATDLELLRNSTNAVTGTNQSEHMQFSIAQLGLLPGTFACRLINSRTASNAIRGLT